MKEVIVVSEEVDGQWEARQAYEVTTTPDYRKVADQFIEDKYSLVQGDEDYEGIRQQINIEHLAVTQLTD